MMTTGRKRGLILTVIGALICVACFLAFYSLVRETENKTWGVETLQLEMQVGENYDLGPYLSEAKGEVQLSPVFASDYKTKECVSLDAQGRLHAMRAGLYDLTLRITTESAFTSRVVKDVLKINLIVHDYEFEDYKPVYSYFDLQGSPNGKYVLARNMIFSDRTKSEIMDFSGILANPNGYTITVSDNLPLFGSVNNNSVIRGLKVRTGKDGFIWDSDKTEDMMWLEPCGLIAIRLSSSVICDSSVEADIYGDPYFHGYVGANDGAILRCEFRGTRFDLAYGVNLDRAFAFSEGGEIRDCTVYADGYREDERIAGDRVSFFHTLPPKEEDFYRNEAEEVLKGNRVFDLSGKHEIDFTKPVVYEAKYLNDVDSSQIFFTLFVGCVAEFPYDMNEFFEQEQAELASYTDDLGNVYDADETWFLPDRVEAKITIKGKYTHTYFSGIEDSRTLNIYAAEEVVELPQGITLNGSVRFGEFSPSKVTLKFNTDTQVEDDLLFLHGEREGSFDSIQVEADLGASMVYEQREDGVYRADNGTLCRYDGAITDGKVTIPDGVTNMTADVFGDREFDCLDTNDLESLSVDSNASWQNNVTTLRLGAAMQISKLYIPDTIGRFSALKTIETEERTDGYYAEDGILYQDDAYEFVPCAYAAGGTLVLQDRVVSSFALTRNLAQTIVFDNVGELKSNAAYVAEFSEVIVMGGDTLVSSNALASCPNLKSFRAEGRVSLRSGALFYCHALETLELNENFVSVAYDAVQNCNEFIGYTQAEGCEQFVISDGILFVDGYARLPRKWMGVNETLTIPKGIPKVTLESETLYSGDTRIFKKIVLNADVEQFSAAGIPVECYELTQESAYLKVEDGVLFSADGTKLLAYPSQKADINYIVPESVTEISDYAFAYAEYLKELDMGPNTEKIGIYSFQGTQISELIFSPKLKLIGEYAFNNAKLSSVVFPDSVESIGRYAFYSATITERIKLPAGLKEIGAHAFRFCYIDEIEIPEGVTSIGEYAFYHSSLKKVIFPESLIKIGQYAFASTQLEEVTLPQNLESVDDFAFDHCSALQTVTTESADVAFGQNCFFETPFLSEGKTAEDGALYLGNTIFALFDEGESLEVRYGTKEIKSLESLKIKSLKLPATLSYIPSIDDLPYLEQLWLGLAPQDAEETTYDVGSMKFKAKSDHLYIFLPKKVTFGGTISDDVYLCYNGTPDEFAVYARLDNFVDFYEYVYYYSQDGNVDNTWYYDENGNMVLRRAASSDKFTYVYSYENNVLQCSIIDCSMPYGSSIEIPSRNPFGNQVTILKGLGDTLFEEVRVSGMTVYFSGEYNFNVKRMYIGEGCEVEHGLGRFVLNIDYLFIDIPELYFYNDEIQYVVVSQNTYRIDVTSKMNVYYEGTKDEWLENVISWTTPYAYYDEDGVFPDDGNLYWHYDESGLPVLWEQV